MAGEAFLWATSRYATGPTARPGSVRNWVMVNPDWVEIKMLGQLRRFYMQDVDVTEDMLHLRYTSVPGIARGVGPLEALTSNLFGAAALERYMAQLAVRGGVPWGVLTVPGNLQQGQAEQLRDNFVAARLSARGRSGGAVRRGPAHPALHQPQGHGAAGAAPVRRGPDSHTAGRAARRCCPCRPATRR